MTRLHHGDTSTECPFSRSTSGGGSNNNNNTILIYPHKQVLNKEASWLHAELFFVLVSMWLPQQHMVSIWTPHGIHVETLWCPVETT